MSFVYLGSVVVSLVAVVIVDLRLRLFVGRSPGRAVIVLATGAAFFTVWDLAGIALGIFLRGESALMTGILLAPELPLEEPLFLLFLCELTMVLFCAAERALGPGERGTS
ncbi:lycopene cyclase domain-containing protein [Microbacterium sp.]|uniref:lycopene cyclase domain-containing protein n=1 Tax=Microbacterium sp. TaxID=51671 RepID=UPI003C74E793